MNDRLEEKSLNILSLLVQKTLKSDAIKKQMLQTETQAEHFESPLLGLPSKPAEPGH